jgi:hypothetical protein
VPPANGTQLREMNDTATALRIDNQIITTDDSPVDGTNCRHCFDDSKSIHGINSQSPSPSQTNEESSCPNEIRVWPQIVLRATQQNLGGAIRIWTFAKALDPSGSGVIRKSQLLSYLESMGVPSASRYRWLRAAVKSNFMRPVRNGSLLLISGIQKTGKLLDCSDIGPRCLINAKKLTITHWKSGVWDLVLSQFKNQPVSRATLFQVTGIPSRTQLELERFGLVKVQHNWCITTISPALITPYIEFSRPHAFVAHFGKQSHVVYQLPNHYTVPKLSGTPDGGGYRRKTYTAASASVKSDTPESPFSGVRFPEIAFRDGGARCEKTHRLYFDREKPFNRALRRLGRTGIEGTLFQKIRIPKGKSKHGWYREEQI